MYTINLKIDSTRIPKKNHNFACDKPFILETFVLHKQSCQSVSMLKTQVS